jgi:NADPH:quinone reductase
VLAPQGKLGVIDDPKTLDVKPLKRKSASLHWEFMFTRAVFNTADILAQHLLLNEAADLVDNGVLRSTLAETLGPINAANLKHAHTLIESGRVRGKLVLEGF